MKFGTFLSNLAKKAGVDVSTPEFIALLPHDIEIPDAIADSLNKGLMDINAAKANADVRKAIRTEALNGVDTKVDELLEEMGLTDDEANDIKGEKNSYEKVAKLTRKVKELESKKAGTTNKQDKDAIEQQIKELNNKLKAANETLATKQKEWEATREGDLTRFDLHRLLLGKESSLPKDLDDDVKLTTLEGAVNKALAAKGYKLVRTDAGLSIVDKDGNKAYSDKHEEVLASSFIDGALAQNKLLKVSDQSQGGGGITDTNQIQGGGQQQQNPYAQQMLNQTNEDLKALGVTL